MANRLNRCLRSKCQPRFSFGNCADRPPVCSPRFWNQGKARPSCWCGAEWFAHLVFGTKAKPRMALRISAGRFAHLVFGTKAKRSEKSLLDEVRFAHLVFGTKAKRRECWCAVFPGLLTSFLEPRQSMSYLDNGSTLGLLTSFLEPRQSVNSLLPLELIGLLTSFLEPRQSRWLR